MCHTHNVTNQYDNTSPKGPRWDIDMETNEHLWALVLVTGQKRRAHQWWLTGARLKIVWKAKAVKCSDILHRRPRPHGTSNQMLPPWEWTWTSTREAYDTPRNKHVHTSHKGGLILPCIPFHLFHFCDMLTRALYNKCRYRYRYTPVEKNPHLFLLHHSHIELTLSQSIQTHLWSMTIPNPLVTDMLV